MGRRPYRGPVEGERFARLRVAEVLPDRGRGKRTMVRCVCDCGTEVTIQPGALTSGNNKSCGCLKAGR